MSKSSTAIIESNKRFSECCLWALQRKYFETAGIDAWVSSVPYYVTSNPYIAKVYANTVIAFIQDWLAQHPESKQNTFYILELGTGSGKFSFYVLKYLQAYLKTLQLDVSLCYVMSDFTDSNIKYWKEHHALKPFVDAGMLDFSTYNLESDQEVHLQVQDITLSPGTIKNPLVVFANYIFDTISQDMFSVSDGQLRETQVTLTTASDNMQGDQVTDWEKVEISHDYKDIKESYYDDDVFNKILEQHKEGLTDSHFLFPIGGLRAIKNLLALCDNRLLLVSSDKGYANLKTMDHLSPPSLAFHGSFSMMVNFHAISEYFSLIGGDNIKQATRKGIKTVLCSSGFTFDKMPQTQLNADHYIKGMSPADYFLLHSNIRDNYSNIDIDSLASHLNFSGWDPHIFQKINQRICEDIATTDYATKQFLCTNMHKIAENFYYMPSAPDTLFEVAIFFHSINDFANALKYYQQSAQHFEPQFGLNFNLGLCHYNLGDKQMALASFKKAHDIEPEAEEAVEWIKHVEAES